MKKLLTSVAIFATTATTAVAQNATATITNVEPRYVTETINRPYQSCYMVDVPVYGQQGGGASSGDVLGGMILGGILGKGASGNDKGAAVGAILGGMVAADNKQNQQSIIGYRQQEKCETRYDSERVTKIKDYRITFEWQGIRGQAYTYNNYVVGDRLPVEVNLRAK